VIKKIDFRNRYFYLYFVSGNHSRFATHDSDKTRIMLRFAKHEDVSGFAFAIGKSKESSGQIFAFGKTLFRAKPKSKPGRRVGEAHIVMKKECYFVCTVNVNQVCLIFKALHMPKNYF
jgi:hypothetical protein